MAVVHHGAVLWGSEYCRDGHVIVGVGEVHYHGLTYRAHVRRGTIVNQECRVQIPTSRRLMGIRLVGGGKSCCRCRRRVSARVKDDNCGGVETNTLLSVE